MRAKTKEQYINEWTNHITPLKLMCLSNDIELNRQVAVAIDLIISLVPKIADNMDLEDN